MTYLTQVAGKKRPHLPKKATGFTESSTTRWDGNDAVAQYGIDRGIDPSYAIPRDAINSDLRLEGSPLIRLTGDEFCSNAESFIWLGQDKNILVGGATLTENNTPTYVIETSDDESSLYEQTVGNLVSGSSQYWSFPTAASVQVGTNSYQTSIAFKTSTTGVLQMMFSYGSHVAAKAYWELGINSSNQIFFAQWDGTNTDTITDTIANRWQDGREHIAIIDIDRTLLKLTLKVDGIFIGSITVTATLTLTIAGENLYIGANKSSGASIVNFFNGNLSLFKLINNAVDYNVPQIWNMGIREAVESGTLTLAANSGAKLNNLFETSTSSGEYKYSTIFTEDGEYEIQEVYQKFSSHGISQLFIDGNLISTVDRYNASATYNNIVKTFGVKLSAGRHTVKYLSNTKNASSSGFFIDTQFVNFIKRRGHENGGVDDFLLLGDEINERSNTTWNFASDTNKYYNSYNANNLSAADQQYTEGTLFIKGGLYRIDYIYYQGTTEGIHNLFFGNVQVINLDANSTNAHNTVKTVYVRLQQGRQDIRLAINGKTGSSYSIVNQSIRGVRISD